MNIFKNIFKSKNKRDVYIIIRNSDTQPYAPYDGNVCDIAKVPKGKKYTDKKEAVLDSIKLNKANSLGHYKVIKL